MKNKRQQKLYRASKIKYQVSSIEELDINVQILAYIDSWYVSIGELF